MKRALFYFLWPLSVLLFAGSVILWIRSHYREDFVTYNTTEFGGSRSVWSRHGRVTFWYDRYIHNGLWRDGAIASRTLGWEIRSTPIKLTLRWPDKNHHFLGFVHAKGVPPRPQYWALAIPWWFITLVWAMPSVVGAMRIVRRARRRPGTCVKCGYDLRASEDRCPECGTAFKSEAHRHEGTEARSEGEGVYLR